ncbi:hypothetical protein P5673_005331 [Acropora cervicornis]|uniref:Uncharacterized protein n=1 Tax=Acropora cervicornis TaxID=6130 RepID=A0AAD9QYB7_ACRCE|nr:hypothetical protein P5673_005331 [Acropora cervicornis]
MPEFSLDNDAAELCAQKERQRRYFNRGKRVLCPVKAGEAIRARSPTGTWKPAECLREVAPRSYEVLVHGAVRRRSRKDIWAPAASPDPDPETPLFGPASSPVEADCVGEPALPSSVHEDSAQPLRRSTRERRPPERFKDFILS